MGDGDEEDEEALGEEEEGEGEIFVFVVTQPRHFVLHIPNTPPHHHLCSFDEKKGARRDRLRQFEIYPNPTVRKTPKKIPIQRAKCQTNPPSRKTTEHLVRKRTKILPRDGVFSQKNKKESFLPPLKTKQNKNFPYQIERKKKNLKVELKEKKNGLRENQTF